MICGGRGTGVAVDLCVGEPQNSRMDVGWGLVGKWVSPSVWEQSSMGIPFRRRERERENEGEKKVREKG